EQSVSSGIEAPPHVDREEEASDELGADGPDCGPAHAERRNAELSEDKDVVQDDIAHGQEDRRRNKNPRSPQTDKQRAVSEIHAGERDAIRRDLKKTIDRGIYGVRLDEPRSRRRPQELEGGR